VRLAVCGQALLLLLIPGAQLLGRVAVARRCSRQACRKACWKACCRTRWSRVCPTASLRAPFVAAPWLALALAGWYLGSTLAEHSSIRAAPQEQYFRGCGRRYWSNVRNYGGLWVLLVVLVTASASADVLLRCATRQPRPAPVTRPASTTGAVRSGTLAAGGGGQREWTSPAEVELRAGPRTPVAAPPR